MTLIEVIIAATIVVAISLVMARMLKLPLIMQRWQQDTEIQNSANLLLDRWSKDMKQCLPETMMSPDVRSAMAFELPQYDTSTGTMNGTETVIYVYHPETSDQGQIYRIEGGTQTTTLDNVLVPTTEEPLFSRDTQLHVVMMSLRVQIPGRPAHRLVRRVALAH